MLTKRSSFVPMVLVALMIVGPLFQTASAQKPARISDSNREDVQRDTAAAPTPGQGRAEVGSLSVNPQKGGLSIPPSQTTPAAPAVCTPAVITQSTSQGITPGNSFAPLVIAPPGAYDRSSYWRAFNVANFVSGNFAVASVDIGVESELGNPKLVTVNLWQSSTAFPIAFPSSLTLLGTATKSIGNQALTIVNIPVTGTAAAGSQLVVEINVPFFLPDMGQLLIGSNASSENGLSFISSDSGLTTPTATATWGKPNMHIVMNVNGCSSPAVAGSSGLAASPWTSSGSTGTVDEDSLPIMQVTNFTLGLLPNATGTVTARYNITGVNGLSRFCPATESNVFIRFRDSDGSGTAARVALEIHRSSVAGGGNDIIYSFDSNGSAQPLGAVFQTFTTKPAIDFDFTTYIYWIEARITKTDPNVFANLGSMQLFESAGTACP